MALKLNHQTEAQFMERFKSRYQSADKMEQARLSAWLDKTLKAGDLKSADVSTAFNLDGTKADEFNQKIESLSLAYAVIKG